jgi:hypothetical protein
MRKPLLQILNLFIRDLKVIYESYSFLDASENGVLALKWVLTEKTFKTSQLIMFVAKEVRIGCCKLIQIREEWCYGMCLLKFRLHLLILVGIIRETYK